MAIRVDDLEATLAELKEKGIRLIDEKPRLGAGGAKISLHPSKGDRRHSARTERTLIYS